MREAYFPVLIRGVPALLFAALGLLAAQSLAVVPGEARLGRFPAWEGRRLSVAVRNAGRGPVRLLGARSSCGCLSAEFRPCTLAPGEETSLEVSVAANSLSGEFRRALFLETDAPGEEFVKVEVSGTAVPAVEVRPRREVYLGRVEAGRPRTFVFRLAPAEPAMELRLLPASPGDGAAEASLMRREGGYDLSLSFTPDAGRPFASVHRTVMVKGRREIPPVRVGVMFAPMRDGVGQ